VRVVVADDAVILREGLARLLREAGFEVAGLAADAEELLELVEQAQPDVARDTGVGDADGEHHRGFDQPGGPERSGIHRMGAQFPDEALDNPLRGAVIAADEHGGREVAVVAERPARDRVGEGRNRGHHPRTRRAACDLLRRRVVKADGQPCVVGLQRVHARPQHPASQRPGIGQRCIDRGERDGQDHHISERRGLRVGANLRSQSHRCVLRGGSTPEHDRVPATGVSLAER